MPYVTVGQKNSANIELYYEHLGEASSTFCDAHSVTIKPVIVTHPSIRTISECVSQCLA
jgi:hypothetical protein